MAITHLYNDNFADAIAASGNLVLVDFWAGWCGPCRMLAPIIEELSGEYEGVLDIFKVDVDEADAIAAQYGIMSIPTVVILKDGEEKERMIGCRPKEDYIQLIRKYL